MSRLRTIRLVAWFELLESLRSRKAIVSLLLFLGGSMVSTSYFISILHNIQEKALEELGTKLTLTEVMESPSMLRLVTRATDADTASAIVQIPPMAIFFGLMATTFVPMLLLITSSGTISGDVASGAVRFSLFRSDRLSWALGKLMGQTCLMAVGVLAGAMGCFLVGATTLIGMPVANTAWWLLRISAMSIVYNFAYLGIAVGASQLVRTNTRAFLLALFLMFVCWFVGIIMRSPTLVKTAPEVVGALSKLFPNGHFLRLWHPGILERASACFGLITISAAFFGLGFWRFARRDS